MIATKRNLRAPRDFHRTPPPASVAPARRSPVVPDPPTPLAEAILTEVNRWGIPASCTSPDHDARREYGPSATPRPITVGRRSGSQAIIVVIDRSQVEFLFGESGDARPSRRLLIRPARARQCANRLCERVTDLATAIDARRLLIVCDAEQATKAERTRAIRWIREVAHRIGYECSINGLHNLATSYLVLVAEVEAGTAARSVVDWYRTGEVR
ncbi:hypothetical protein IU448_18525 [Nocardia flavorosea]|uniref:hypothetical protein n=1 Tax=Nocardia flavorosea TaxID=53429 RepID=UPI001895B4B7|nr:hypothetical protein [Nocardia flavorosea]MBF6350996.1 hypothetical protein [Nocardia flavorosea]